MYKSYNKTIAIYKVVSKNYKGCSSYCCCLRVTLGVSTVHEIVTQVCQSIVENLWEDCVKKHMPCTEEDFKDKMKEMNERWQFPFCWAAIDGCHIPIKCPPGGAASCKEYHNFKNFYSVVLMAMVDSKYRFIWGSCGFPSNSHDAIIFQATELWEKLNEHDFIPDIAHKVADVNIGPLITGDSAFQFKPCLLKPYTNAVLTEKQRYFSYRLSRPTTSSKNVETLSRKNNLSCFKSLLVTGL